MVKKKHGVILVASVSIAVIALGIVCSCSFAISSTWRPLRFRLGCGNCRSGNFHLHERRPL